MVWCGARTLARAGGRFAPGEGMIYLEGINSGLIRHFAFCRIYKIEALGLLDDFLIQHQTSPARLPTPPSTTSPRESAIPPPHPYASPIRLFKAPTLSRPRSITLQRRRLLGYQNEGERGAARDMGRRDFR